MKNSYCFQKIGNNGIDTYGDQASDVPDHLFDQLLNNHTYKQ